MMVLLLTLLLLLLLGLEPKPTFAIPPASPIQCNASVCVLSNAYGTWGDRKACWVPSVAYPKTEEDLRAAVAFASREKLRVKIVSGFSHTIPKLACPDPTPGSLLISTSEYKSGIEINLSELTVTADSGVGLRDLIDEVERSGLSLAAAPYWSGVSVGGLVSTGSHGSSWWGRGGAVHDHVVGLRLVVPAGEVDGYARIVELAGSDPLFDAARVSLGLLGVISKVTFSLEKGFKRSITYFYEEDGGLEDRFTELARSHEFGDITWYPSQHKAVYRYDDRVPMSTAGDGVNDFLGFQSTPSLDSIQVRATEKSLERSMNVTGKCALAVAQLEAKKLLANGLTNNLIFTGYPVVGRQGKMQTSGSCQHSSTLDLLSMCAWDPRIEGAFFYETTAIFPASRFRDFVLDVKKLRDIDANNFCGMDLYTGFLVRFIKGSSTYLGQPKDSVVVDFNYYRADDPLTPRLNEDIWEEVEQMAFFKHGARPHWGKNRAVAFSGVKRKYPKIGKFVSAMKQLDPKGMFYSAWSEDLLFGKASSKDDGCALEGQCVCSEDRHCSPSNGYFCKPGLVYRQARVCRFSEPWY